MKCFYSFKCFYTDFDQDGKHDEIGFIIKKIKIHTDPDVEGYRYKGNYGVEKFLELVSEENYDFVCLSYMFTYRDFEGGTLGLAWTADLHNAGGICDKYNVSIFMSKKKACRCETRADQKM